MFFIPIDLQIMNADIHYTTEDTREYSILDYIFPTDDKPIIYLYPTKETKVKVLINIRAFTFKNFIFFLLFPGLYILRQSVRHFCILQFPAT